jgi:hypothetical protein
MTGTLVWKAVLFASTEITRGRQQTAATVHLIDRILATDSPRLRSRRRKVWVNRQSVLRVEGGVFETEIDDSFFKKAGDVIKIQRDFRTARMWSELERCAWLEWPTDCLSEYQPAKRNTLYICIVCGGNAVGSDWWTGRAVVQKCSGRAGFEPRSEYPLSWLKFSQLSQTDITMFLRLGEISSVDRGEYEDDRLLEYFTM